MKNSFFDEMKHNNVEEVTTPKVGSIFVPTLTASGWVNSIAESVDYLLSYYFTTYKWNEIDKKILQYFNSQSKKNFRYCI